MLANCSRTALTTTFNANKGPAKLIRQHLKRVDKHSRLKLLQRDSNPQLLSSYTNIGKFG